MCRGGDEAVNVVDEKQVGQLDAIELCVELGGEELWIVSERGYEVEVCCRDGHAEKGIRLGGGGG